MHAYERDLHLILTRGPWSLPAARNKVNDSLCATPRSGLRFLKRVVLPSARPLRSQLLQQPSRYPLGVKWSYLSSFFAVQGFHFHDSVLNRKRSAEWMAADFNCNLLPDGQTLVCHGLSANYRLVILGTRFHSRISRAPCEPP